MTQEEWDKATEEERDAEFECCKNPFYVYNTYYVMPDGSKPPPISQEDWDARTKEYEEMQFNRFRNYRRRL